MRTIYHANLAMGGSKAWILSATIDRAWTVNTKIILVPFAVGITMRRLAHLKRAWHPGHAGAMCRSADVAPIAVQ